MTTTTGKYVQAYLQIIYLHINCDECSPLESLQTGIIWSTFVLLVYVRPPFWFPACVRRLQRGRAHMQNRSVRTGLYHETDSWILQWLVVLGFEPGILVCEWQDYWTQLPRAWSVLFRSSQEQVTVMGCQLRGTTPLDHRLGSFKILSSQ